MKNTEIATKEAYSLVALPADLADIYAEELDGLGTVGPDIVKIPSGGGLAFEVPGDDPEAPDVEKTLDVVILYHHAMNSRWDKQYEGGNEPPVCASRDGMLGIDGRGEVHDCATCAYNQFSEDGAGKACKNTHVLYMLRDGCPMPLQLSLPPTALTAARKYFGRMVMRNGLRSFQYVTRIGLKKETNKGGITYSVPTFAFVCALDEAQQETALKAATALKAMMDELAAKNLDVAEPAPEPAFTDVADVPSEFTSEAPIAAASLKDMVEAQQLTFEEC